MPEIIYFLDIVEDISKDCNYDMSIYIKKLDPIKTLNDITYNISISQSELYTISKNQRNIDIINKSNKEAKELRKKIQIENQEIYSIAMLFTFSSQDYNYIFKILSEFRAKLYSRQIGTEITNFRHLEFYLSNLPLQIKNKFLQNSMYITSNSLANIFPFYTKSIMDINGIILGYTKNEKRLCIVDIFSSKYENSNMCILGSSGSGKSFFTKLFILRNFFYNRVQIILDIENEYSNLCSSLGGQCISQDSYYNIFQITNRDLMQEDFLDKKISHIITVFEYLGCLEYLNIEELRHEIKKLYKEYSISNDISSVIEKQDGDIVSLDYKIMSNDKFPTLNKLIETTKNEEVKNVLEKHIHGKLKFFSNTTNIDLDNNLYVININGSLNDEMLIQYMLNFILENNMSKDKKTIIYIDEMWKYISDTNILNCIVNMYKTIRKRNGAIITITQDITDFFEYQNGKYANSILNNSCFKLIFKTEYKEKEIFNRVINIEEDKLSTLKKGEAFLIINKSSVNVKVVANSFEGEIINENGNCNR